MRRLLLMSTFALLVAGCSSGASSTSPSSTRTPSSTTTAGDAEPITTSSPPLDGRDCASAMGRPTTHRYAETPGVDADLQSVDVYAIDAPEGCGLRPALIWVHGGGWRVGDKGGRAILQKAAFAAEHAWVLVSVNYRLSSPGADVQWPDHGEDVAAATAWVLDHAEELGVDAGRVALMGHSAGGHLVSIVATDPDLMEATGHDRTEIGCVVALDTEGYDLEAKAAGALTPQSEALLANAFGTDPAVRVAASPTQALADHGGPVAPFLVVTRGSPYRQGIATDFATAARAAGSEAEVLTASGYSHAGVNLAVGDPPDATVNPAVTRFLVDCLQSG